jgi:F-type H+-transporting ATPase subunit epsilon
MRLTVTTPLKVVLEISDVEHVRAEDASGAFGILPGHANFLTVLTTSVMTWRDIAGAEHYIAVRGGVLEVSHDTVAITTREAVIGEDFRQLESEVLARFQHELQEEHTARADAQRLYLAALRQIVQYLRRDGHARPQGAPLGAAQRSAQ